MGLFSREKKCERCGNEFIPAKPYYKICQDCYGDRYSWEDSFRARTFREFNNQCAYCGKKPFHLDHVIPVAEISPYTPEYGMRIAPGYEEIDRDQTNFVPACVRCNSSKSDNDLVEWYSRQPCFSVDRLYKILCHMRHPKQRWCDYITSLTGNEVF